MAEEWIARSFGISGATVPVSGDLAADRAAAQALITLIEYGEPLEEAFLDGLGIAVTPWVAWQIGIYTEHVAAGTEHALAAVAVAVWAASRSQDPARVLANRLTAANTCLRAGALPLAERFYESILETPLSLDSPERAGAYGGMANLSLLRDDFCDAAYYFDKCLSSDHQILDEDGRRHMLANAVRCCLYCQDLGGALVFLRHLDAHAADALEQDLRTRVLPLEDRLLLVARLHVLGAGPLAEALLATWNKGAVPP